MDRRTILFIAISVAIVVLYQELVLRPLTPHAPPEPAPTSMVAGGRSQGTAPEGGVPRSAASPGATAQPASTDPLSPDAETAAAQAPLTGEPIVIETDLFRAVLTTLGGRLESLTLKKYRTTPAPDSPGLEVVQAQPGFDLPLGVELRGARVWSDARSVYTADKMELNLAGSAEGTIELRSPVGDQAIVKRFTFRGDRYVVDLGVEVPGAAAIPAELSAAGGDGQGVSTALVLTRRVAMPHSRSFGGAAPFEGAAALIDNKLHQKGQQDLGEPVRFDGPVQWAGNEDHYFLNAAAPRNGTSVLMRAQENDVETRILTPRTAAAPEPLQYALFLGPKEERALEDAGNGFARALNLGWFGPISLLLLRILTLSHRVTHNYGIDIILLTVLVKIVFWPLTQKSFQSMRQMQKLQPEMQKLREKYKDDPKQMNTEIMELYRRHKVNPLGGCLPMVLQIPVFFGLYQALANTIQLRHAPFAFWVQDLSAPERLDVFGYGIPVLTILLGVTMFLQQKMAPQAGDPAQQRIMMFMPILFTFMFIGFPAGLTLYWLTNNVLTIAQQYFILRKAPA